MDCSKPPFNNKKIRLALALALCKNDIAKNFSKEAVPHYSFYPKGIEHEYNIFDDSPDRISLAQKFFHEAITENPDLEDKLFEQKIYVWDQSQMGDFLCQQINQVFNLNWSPLSERRMSFSQYLKKRKNSIKSYGWINPTTDPKYFLGIFSSTKYLANPTKWTHPFLQFIIKKFRQTDSAEMHKDLLVQAQEILIDEMPMIPLFYTQTYCLSHLNIREITSNPMQHFDIRGVYKL